MVVSVDPGQLRHRARAWLELDPDRDTIAATRLMLDTDDLEGLDACFGARLTFGTAGLRAPLGPGPNRMNRVIVRQTAAGLARRLGRNAVVVIGRDARHKSDAFAADSAAVFAAAGCRVLVFERGVTTPVLAFAVRHLGADAGVMVTASHNPPADNGYKMYGPEGIQIVPPTDLEVAAAIDAVVAEGGAPALADLDDARIERLDVSSEHGVVDAYLDAAIAPLALPDARHVSVVHTSLHGMADEVTIAAFARAGFAQPHVVVAQARPDPGFPTVRIPNPEEVGVLDLALALAAERDAGVVLANDPDGDRLGVAVPTRAGWRRLSGDEVGALLGDHLLRHSSGSDRLVVRTVVSSRLLERMAAEHGVHTAVTLTGTKWIPRPALSRPDLRFVFGYEESLGYLVSREILEKDGTAAGLLVAEIVADLGSAGRTVTDRLAELATTYGLHHSGQRSVSLVGPHPSSVRDELMGRLRAATPAAFAGRRVDAVRDLLADPELPRSDVLVFDLEGGAWLAVRPSGTEPKVKVYAEVVRPLARASDFEDERQVAAAEVDELLGSVIAG